MPLIRVKDALAGIWQTAEFTSKDGGVSMFAYHFAKSLNRPGIPQGFITISSGGKDATASPLSWTSFAGVRGLAIPVSATD